MARYVPLVSAIRVRLGLVLVCMASAATFSSRALAADEAMLAFAKTADGAQVTGQIAGDDVLKLAIQAISTKKEAAPVAVWLDKIVVKQPTPAELELSLPEGVELTLKADGKAFGQDVFPCAAHAVAGRTPIIRSVSGLSHNGLNTGVYSRTGDWAAEIAGGDALDVEPAGKVDAGQLCSIHATGRKLSIKLTPRLYQRELGMEYFRPAEYSLASRVPSGWISWKAYRGAVTQDDVHKVADWLAANLKDYGLDYLIIDDGWFVGSNRTMLHSVPDGVDWTRGNDGFSDGLGALADYVHQRGLKVGLWYSPFGSSTKTLLEKHPDWWVHKGAGGEILKSSWHGVAFCDGTNPEACNGWLVRGIRAGAEAGIDYFKVDGQKHTAYDAYEKSGDYFTARNITWQDALRDGWSAIRSAAGDRYVLACWGRVPQIAGYPLAIRIGSDKDSSWKSITEAAKDLSLWFHEHNIVWCDDPDHMVFVKLNVAECRTWATLLALTGTHLTFSDTTDVYTPEKLNILRRALPIVHSPVTRPAELYSVDEPPALWTLEIDRPFDHWLVVANSSVGKPVESLQFEQLGLSPDKDYSVYDFWNDEFKGVFRGSYTCGRPGEHDTQVFAIREVREHPWIVSTNRHVTQGAVDLNDVTWDAAAGTLSGVSNVVAGDSYAVTAYAPKGYEADSAKFGDAAAELVAKNGAVKVRFTPTATGVVHWTIKFRKAAAGG